MKRTLMVLTAAIFASAIAVPAFAQDSGASAEASPAAMASPSSGKKHHHGHHKKKSESTDSGGMAPSAAPSDATSK